LGTEAVVAEQFVHIAEEPPINPSLLISLYGCGLRCRYCQQWELLDPAKAGGKRLEASLWESLDIEGARSLSFIGGNPDESLYAILRFLASGPPDWELPVAWNCNAYATPEVVQLLDGVVGAYVPDFKYGDERCSRELSHAPGYPAAARAALRAMIAQHVPVIVRILVLPGHFKCCHVTVLDFLGSLACDNLLVSVRGQYCPDWRINAKDGEMARRPYPEEVGEVREKALSLGLNLV
jgi:putative pyruvate formate lyase activating enzyme